MSSSTQRKRIRKSPADRRAEIVDAAAAIALTEGLECITLRRVAERLGVRPGLIGHCFPAVEDLVAEAFGTAAGGELESLLPADRAAGTPTDHLARFFALATDAAYDDISRLWINARHLSRYRPVLRDRVGHQEALWRGRLEELVREGVDRGEFRSEDPYVTTIQILEVIDGLGAHANTSAEGLPEIVTRMAVGTAERELGLESGTLTRRAAALDAGGGSWTPAMSEPVDEDASARAGSRKLTGQPLPIDMTVACRAAEAMRAAASDACTAAGVPDGSGRLMELLRPECDSFQEFAAGLRYGAGPDHVPLIPELCAGILGDDARTDRTLAGDRRVDAPFFHHGDLVVRGHLDIAAPFVVTGSLTVEGCLADCGPDSVVAVGDGVTAHAVHTDGEMSVGGDISAEVVYGHYNDHTLQAATIRARLVIEDEHCTIAAVEADTHFDLDDFRQGYGEGVQERLRELLVDEVFSDEEGEEQLDRSLPFGRMREGLPVFRAKDA